MTCEELLSAYIGTLTNGFACKEDPSGRLCVVTPYPYPDHDNIEVFVRERTDSIVVSDLGETLRRLDMLGVDAYGTPNILFQVKRLADGFEVVLQNGVLLKEGKRERTGQLAFDVICACQAVAALVYGSKAYEPASFQDEVNGYLNEHGMRAERRFLISGTSGTNYRIDFGIESSARTVLVETISPKTTAGVKGRVNAVFREWYDIPAANGKPREKLSLLNDDFSFRTEDLNLLRQHSRVHHWADRDDFLNDIRASLQATTELPNLQSPPEPKG